MSNHEDDYAEEIGKSKPKKQFFKKAALKTIVGNISTYNSNPLQHTP